MKLRELLVEAPECRVTGTVDRSVTGVCYDSRRLQPDNVFFAWRGRAQDGHQFIAQACDRGASAIVLENPAFVASSGPTYVEVSDARRALARMAGAYHGHPARKMQIAGITGTNGKTTTAFVLKHLLEGQGAPVGLIGTVRYEVGGRVLDASRTTPEGSDLHDLFAQMVAAGCKKAVMEVSSHALDQGRVDGIAYAVGIFTNLTQDHLDYHGTMEEYGKAKLRLFQSLERGAQSGTAVLNADDPASAQIQAALSSNVRVLTYSCQKQANVWADNIRLHTLGTDCLLHLGAEAFSITLPLLGFYNLANALGAAAAALSLGVSASTVAERLQTTPGVPGRLESFTSADGVCAVVDYAHTEDALRKALGVLRQLNPKRLIAVVGCGGNRDKGKRPLMARAAVELADQAIFTADNPRSESIEAILSEMEAGVKGSKSGESKPGSFTSYPDRREAIAFALAQAQPGDLVCIAGKGHETTQEIEGKFLPFDDRSVVRQLLAKRGTV